MGNFWLLYSVSSLICLAAVAFLVWLILPSRAWLETRRWLASQHLGRYDHWIRYRTVRRWVTLHAIAMNAATNSSFSPEELDQINALFRKLGQPPAASFSAQTGDRFDARKMQALPGKPGGHTKLVWVLEVPGFGVEWRGETLKKVDVIACTADHLMIHQLAAAAARADPVIGEFVAFLERKSLLAPGFELPAALLQGFIDLPADVNRGARPWRPGSHLGSRDNCLRVRSNTIQRSSLALSIA